MATHSATHRLASRRPPVTVAALPPEGSAAGGSERSLFDLFAAFLDTTPMAYVHARRLAWARRRLLAGDGPIAKVAADAGLHHPGRFSQSYFGTYGEKPSETLADAVHKLQDLSKG